MNTLEVFHMRYQRQILDVCWWAHVSNAEVLQRSGLSTTGDILRHRPYLWSCCTPGPWSTSTLRSVSVYFCTKAESQWPAREDHRIALATSCSTRFRRMPTLYCYLRRGDLRSPGVTERRSGHLEYATTTTIFLVKNGA